MAPEIASWAILTGSAAGPTPSNARFAIARWNALRPWGADASSSTPSLASACASDMRGEYGRRPIASVPMSAEAGVRLRQAVLVARDLDPVSKRLRDELGLGEPFADPGVGAFGLHNAVYAIGHAAGDGRRPVSRPPRRRRVHAHPPVRGPRRRPLARRRVGNAHRLAAGP